MDVKQHISATVSLAGPQAVAIDTHGTQGNAAGSHLSVAYAGVLLWFFDRRTADTYTSAWTDLHMATLGRALPARREMQLELTSQNPITLAVRAHHEDEISRIRLRDALVITTGAIRWAIFDQAAFNDMLALWRQVGELSRIVLPLAYLPTA